MPNHLQDQTSPYLLQHAHNPVDWYPWGEEAFRKAQAEDKPVFLSIGYSTCHWCHVMARESFEDEGVARLLNDNFVSIKVDREERPDVDSIYISVCQALNGSAGWPASIFMTGEQRPFFAGTYFPKTPAYGSPAFPDLLALIAEKWRTDRAGLLAAAGRLTRRLRRAESEAGRRGAGPETAGGPDPELLTRAYAHFCRSFDPVNGGFGPAPKFPVPHSLLFLMSYYSKKGPAKALSMAERSLEQMYRGGLFDHIGGGFCRYSTDAYYLAPHFEKMLYDNALLIMAYAQAYEHSGRALYLETAQRVAAYLLRELRADNGGFYSAQDADSQGEEGKYYLFRPQELLELLGREAGERFNKYFDITKAGNVQGQSIPNLLSTPELTHEVDPYLEQVYQYRRSRYPLSVDDKQLTAWNSLAVSALCRLYRVSGRHAYLQAALEAEEFIRRELGGEEGRLYVSWRRGRPGPGGFLQDYAAYAWALLDLHQATLDEKYLQEAARLARRSLADFSDEEGGGFYMYAPDREQLLLRPKESYDGALPSGNSLMAAVLVQLSQLLPQEEEWLRAAERQLTWLSGQAASFPAGQTLFLLALSDWLQPLPHLTVVPATAEQRQELAADLPCRLPLTLLTRLLPGPQPDYPLKEGLTTYYLCHERACRPGVNYLPELP